MARRALCLVAVLLAAPLLHAQAADGPGVVAGQNTQSGAGADPTDAIARGLLALLILGLGGDAWLHRKNTLMEGRISAFFQGKPTGDITNFISLSTPTTAAGPGLERLEYGKHHDVFSIFSGREAWEITFRGKRPIPEEQASDYFRRRDHSLDEVVQVWMNDPGTIFVAEGQQMAESHLADQITLITAANDSITLQLDTGTHLPLRRLFEWRDPVYKDKNHEIEDYDDYHIIDGIATPFTVTRVHNGDIVSQRYLYHAQYNVPAAPDAFDADAIAAHIKH